MTTIPSARDDNDAAAPWRCPKCGGDETWFDRTWPAVTRCTKCGRDVSGLDATPSTAAAVSAPEGNDALRALNEMLAWVDDGDNGALTAFAEAFDEWSEAGEMAGQAVFVLRERLIRLALPQAAKATAGDARPPSPPEGKDDSGYDDPETCISDALVTTALMRHQADAAAVTVMRWLYRHGFTVVGPTQADADAVPLRASPCAPPEGNDVPPLTELSPVADVGVIVENRASGVRWQWTGKVWAKLPAGAPQADAHAHPPSASPQSAPEGKGAN